MSRFYLGVSLVVSSIVMVACAEDRWRILPDRTGIEWPVAVDSRLPHDDTLEMSGERVSLILKYGVSSNRVLRIDRHLEWPDLRVQPNDTYGNYDRDFADEDIPSIAIDGRRLCEKPHRITWDGVLTIESDAGAGMTVCRRIFPSAKNAASLEILKMRNGSSTAVEVSALTPSNVAYRLGCTGRYVSAAVIRPAGTVRLEPGASATFGIACFARRADQPDVAFDFEAELEGRIGRIRELADVVVLETGDPLYDTAFRLAKIRAGESVFRTRGGVVHSPGGGTYYAATWCNDQIEYAGPWQAMTGDALSLEAAYTGYCQYLPFMADDYAPIPSSVIAEGFDIWNGAGDRGDAAMWAYGACRFVLATGRRDWAEHLRPGIRWCLEYCRRKLTKAGVVASDTDELEGRLPSGNANLCTSALYCDALRHASYLERDLGDVERADLYARQSESMGAVIETYFGRDVHGFKTYRYYEGCDILRSWIGIPLCMGLKDRASGTVAALFSSYLWTGDGMLSAEGEKTRMTWDRSALYSFRGAFAVGLGAEVSDQFRTYTISRVLGEHVPYPVEAWPEGGRRHLSAESALYCRVFTEGLFGLDPIGLGTFAMSACLPKGVTAAHLRSVRFGNRLVDLDAMKTGAVVVREHADQK